MNKPASSVEPLCTPRNSCKIISFGNLVWPLGIIVEACTYICAQDIPPLLYRSFRIETFIILLREYSTFIGGRFVFCRHYADRFRTLLDCSTTLGLVRFDQNLFKSYDILSLFVVLLQPARTRQNRSPDLHIIRFALYRSVLGLCSGSTGCSSRLHKNNDEC